MSQDTAKWRFESGGAAPRREHLLRASATDAFGGMHHVTAYRRNRKKR